MATGFCECGCGSRTNLAPQSRSKTGQVKGEPLRFIRGHIPRKFPRWKSEDRGYTTPCWIWQLACDPSRGYGRVGVERKVRYAHRVEWERINGPVPEGKELDHLCHQRACVNPDHLEPVTHAENCRRKEPVAV